MSFLFPCIHNPGISSAHRGVFYIRKLKCETVYACVCVFVCAHAYMNTCDQRGKKILLQIINEIMIGTSFIPVVVKRKDRFYSCVCTSLTGANTHTFCIPKITKWEMKRGGGERVNCWKWLSLRVFSNNEKGAPLWTLDSLPENKNLKAFCYL